jgi:hypothetical protein
MSEELQQRPQIHDLNKIMMFTETPGAPGKRSKLAWSVRDGAPRLTVFTNDPKDQVNKGIMYAPMNPETFYAFMDLFEQVTKSPSGTKYKIDCLTSSRDQAGNIKQDEKVLLSEIWFGKDDAGLIWLSCVAPNRPKIKFTFKVSDYHRIFKDGNPLSESEASCLQAMATIRILRNAFYSHVSALKPTTPVNGDRPRTSFNNNSNNSYNQNRQQREETKVEDIPF